MMDGRLVILISISLTLFDGIPVVSYVSKKTNRFKQLGEFFDLIHPVNQQLLTSIKNTSNPKQQLELLKDIGKRFGGNL